MYNPFNHTCYSVGRESSFELDVTTSWRGNGKKTCLLARALRALHPVDTIRFLYNRSNGGRGPSSFSFFHLFARVIASSLRRSRSVSRSVRIVTMLCKEGLLCEVEREIEMLATDMREIEGMLFLSNILEEILSGWKMYSEFVFLPWNNIKRV